MCRLQPTILLDSNQSGFRTAHSTEMALLTVVKSLRAARALSHSSVLILLDLSSPFDKINHQILLSALAELGNADSALTWFISYLTNCTFQVTWNGSLSKPCFLETGVPQVSVLGPLLFSLYTRSLGSATTSHGISYHCYADDTQLFLSFPHPPPKPTLQCPMSECLADISTWTAAHHLILDLCRTELLFIPVKDCPYMDLSVSVEDITTLYNICRIWSFLTKDANQLLVQALVIYRLDCNSLSLESELHPSTSTHRPYLIQDDGVGLQGRQWNCTYGPQNAGHNTHSSASTSLHYISRPAGTTIAESKQSRSVKSRHFLVWSP
ncbi:uncharacterized protein LOC115577759 isoform X2 [Sparus aurata]|uniref:uncharacterized protein LOC115577759 isoform X2 n=1 Tax=Sparus aurata TaxID=8175 RepID=UPI0011C1B9BB|nr:uncharacterized protein LOC115577759 isoform X2 [Sparus aurata]